MLDLIISNSNLDNSIESRTFIGPTFRNIVIRNSSMEHIHHEAFMSLELETLLLHNVSVADKVFTQAFDKVSAKKFEIRESSFNSIDTTAFDISVKNTLVLESLLINELDRRAFYDIETKGSFLMSEIEIESYENGALVLEIYSESVII